MQIKKLEEIPLQRSGLGCCAITAATAAKGFFSFRSHSRGMLGLQRHRTYVHCVEFNVV